MTDEFRQPGSGHEDSGYDGWTSPNAFARMKGPDPLLQLINARYKFFGGPWDAGRFARKQYLTSKAPVTEVSPLLRQNPQYQTGAQAQFIRQETINRQLDQLYALDAQLATTAERKRGQEKAAAQAAKLDAEHRRIASSRTGGSPTADLLSIIGTEVVLDIAERKRRSERNQRILSVGRRGAAATRPLQSTAAGLTNRTGAKSTRAVPSTVPSTVAAPVPVDPGTAAASSPAAEGLGDTGSNPLTTPSESEESQAARDAMGSSRSLPRASATARAPSALGQFFANLFTPTPQPQGMRLSAPRVRALPRARSGVTGVRSTPAPATLLAVPGQQPALTALNTQGVASAQNDCRCPSPERKKPKKERCTNPVISRSEKDGILTTKRKLQCPPSKPK